MHNFYVVSGGVARLALLAPSAKGPVSGTHIRSMAMLLWHKFGGEGYSSAVHCLQTF